jgi:hypothetical protein
MLMRAADPAARLYQEFRTLNAEFKVLCTCWQLRDPAAIPLVLNDHSDAGYDAAVIAGLGRLHARADDLLRHGSAALAGLAGYRGRLGRALAGLVAGDTSKFTAPAAGSYHDIWMELHEYLLLKLGLPREEEDA